MIIVTNYEKGITMTEKTTIQEAEETYAEQASELIRAWHAAQDSIAQAPATIEGELADLLTAEQRAQAQREQKAQRAGSEAESYRLQYTAIQEERNDSVRERARGLHKQLYAVENADILSRAALSTDDQLRDLMALSETTGNPELAKSVFVVAEQRQLGEVLAAYFQANPEAAAQYAELQASPSEQSMERRLGDAATLFAAPTPMAYAPARTRA